VGRYNETGNCNLKRDSKLGRSRIFDNKELVLKCIEDDPNISGKEIKAKLAPTISNACFYNSLKRMGLTYKKKNVDTSKGVRRKELNTGSWLLK
jgi:transposase